MRFACFALAALSCQHGIGAAEFEYQVKGAFLLNFPKFIDWPPSAFRDENAPIVVCILGDDPFGAQIDAAARCEMPQNRRLLIRRVKRLEDVPTCHILFVSHSDLHRPSDISERLKDSSTLVVGEERRFAAQGGVIAFVIDDGRVRFVINEASEKRAGLRISSQLKQLALEIINK